MESALQDAHILLFPSYYGEGLSRLMLEAGYARICPVAYNIPANRDLIANGRGFLVEKGNLQQVIRILLSMAADRDSAAANAAAYQEFIAKNYGRVEFTKRLDGLFRKMIAFE
jgi:glycosyltransferase involved in cell wall biosynthesis